jgi:hypothetical protein
MTTTISRRTELAPRASDGIDVYLFWNEPTSRVIAGVRDARGDDSFEFEWTDATRSTPSTIPTYAGCRYSGDDPQPTSIKPWMTDHAPTDR